MSIENKLKIDFRYYTAKGYLMYTIDIMTLFPEPVALMLGTSIIGRAQKRGLLEVCCHQIRDYTTNKQMQVDDYPYGGGHGCVMQCQPLCDCLKAIRELRDGKNVRTIYLSPCGKVFTENDAKRLSNSFDGIILVCGHYEGVDERFIEECVDEEISVGDFVLTGGEIPALAVADAVARLLPNVLSEGSVTEESHWAGLLEYPQYSRPEVWNGRQVPTVLLSGNHAEIKRWRFKQSLFRTKSRRPDMYNSLRFETKQEKRLLAEIEYEWENERMEELLDKYAELIIRKGINIQPNQTLLVSCHVDNADFARRCVKKAYEAGCREVIMNWGDDTISRETWLHANDEIFDTIRPWEAEKANTLASEGAAFLNLTSGDPEAMAGVDPERMRRKSVVASKATAPYREALMSDKLQWCVAAVPNVKWAKKMFPDMKEEKAFKKQWDSILTTSRVYEETSPIDEWDKHIDTLHRRAAKLNEYNFKYLKYSNSLGTDLTVELPEGHFWQGGDSKSEKGIQFLPNIPTEELYTAPKRDGVNGIVYASKPLVLSDIVDKFWFRFENGKIVELHAEKNEKILRTETTVDEGASYLGEVALVPYDSPISNTGLLFYNTLFDENAACHLAFGDSYPCVEGTSDLSWQERLEKHGLNHSITHCDFMVGTKDLSVIGVTHDGTEIPVFVNGNFAPNL